jgi:hypothetical protein
MIPHRNIHKYNWTSPDGKTQNQNDHLLIHRRWHSSILEVQSFRRDDCDTDHYLVVAKVRERFAICKQAAQKFDMEKFNFRKLNEQEARIQYQIKFSNRYSALENLGDKWVNDVKQTEIHTAEPLVPKPSAFDVELA